MRRELAQKNLIALASLLVSVSCLLIVILIVFKLPEASTRDREIGFYPTIKSRKVSQNAIGLGKFGEMMVEMLPQDLAFTVFVPSEEAFNRDLHLLVNDSLVPEKFDDTSATISRILSFSAIPRALSSVNVPFGEHLSYDSLSGVPLYISKDIDGTLVVNRIRSEVVDVKKKEILIHVMDGVIMDADFEESVLLDNTEDSEEDSLQ